MHNSIKQAVIIHKYTFPLLGFEQNDLLIFITLQCQKNKMFVTYCTYMKRLSDNYVIYIVRGKMSRLYSGRRPLSNRSTWLESSSPCWTKIMHNPPCQFSNSLSVEQLQDLSPDEIRLEASFCVFLLFVLLWLRVVRAK